jgi:ribosomal protein L12E/L44/L45/RPP1/RPP2
LSKRKKKKKGGCALALMKLLIAFVILVLILVVAGYFLKDKISSVVAEKLVTQTANSLGVDSSKAQELYDSLPDEDKEEVQSIVSEHLTPSAASTLIESYTKGDYAAIADYAKSELTTEEQQYLLNLYNEYGSSYGE